ncbi:MAG: TonB-dependent receptor [Bacteroidetes bacterium]|nr:TonB-dependent receptor [Bacteroidota bacterium]
MRKLLFVLGLLIFQGLQAQQVRTLSGKVTSSDNNPVSGASITVQGAGRNAAVAANANGEFTIAVPSNRSFRLSITAVGFEPQIISSSDIHGDQINISLKDNAKGLNEVVVVGYGTARKKDLTGSVASVSLTNNEKTPILGTSQLLEGTVSGVQVTQTNSQPGASFTVRIRGTNSISFSSDPLYVLDGYAGADLSTLASTDIASIEVLKDASATAIYGSRGANGVVLITTKKGATGKAVVSFDAYTGNQSVSNKLKMMDATQFATYLNLVTSTNNANNGTTTKLPFTQDQINALGKGTDWQDALYSTARVSNYAISVSGGSADNHYYLGASYFDQQGVLLNTGYKRGSLRFNMDSKISEKVRVGLNASISYDWQSKGNINTNGGSSGGTILDALRASPTVPIYDSTGNFTFQNGPLPYVDQLGNPVAAAVQNTDKGNNIRVFTNAFAEYEIIKGLRLRSSIGGELMNYREDIFKPTISYLAPLGQAQVNTNNNYNYLNENTLTYDKTYGIHAFNVVAGWTYQYWRFRSANTTATGLSSNSYGTDNLSVGSAVSTTSNTTKNVLSSGLARINYRLMDKYLFTFTMRADGSSRFGENKKWGYFPSGAVAWRMSDEKFVQKIDAISDLKLRLSYGLSGNQDIGSYNSLTQYTTNTYYLNGTRVVGISPNNIANADLSWEQTSTFDAGIDLGLLKNRITFNADYYNKKTSKLLYYVTLPQTSGFANMLQNIGAVRNQGFEFSIKTLNIQTSKLRWTTALNFSRNINKILSLGPVSYQYTGNVSTSLYPSGGQVSAILQVGQPIGSFFGYKYQGIWQSADDIKKSGTKQAVRPGDPRYADLNGDSAITAADRTIIGHALPKFTYGFVSDLTVGRFNLYVLIQGVYGDNILNENRIEMENGTTTDNKFAYVSTDSWTPNSGNNKLPSVVSTLRRTLGVTSDIIEDGSYLRVKTVTLSYDLPLPKLTGVFKSAVVYVTGQNLITATHYSGYDPEVNSYSNSAGNYTSLNTDYNPYPNVRSYLAGIKLGF